MINSRENRYVLAELPWAGSNAVQKKLFHNDGAERMLQKHAAAFNQEFGWESNTERDVARIDGAVARADWVSPYKGGEGADAAGDLRASPRLLRWGYSTVLPRMEGIRVAARAKRRLVCNMSGR
jgi:hypothetical protein